MSNTSNHQAELLEHSNNFNSGAYPITTDTKYRVLLFYKYTNVADPAALMDRERAICEVLDLKGRIIVAEEGINGTIEGTMENTEKYIEHMRRDKRFRMMPFKESAGTGDAFPRLSVKVRPELVGQRFPKRINPNKATGKYLNPAELKRWFADKRDDFVVIDMRNDYELQLGRFDKTVEIGLQNSRDLAKEEVLDKIRVHRDKKLVTVCNGDVRCEKMSAYLVDAGFDNVYQLQDGIHTYMQKFPGEDFQGTLYTFDGRKTMHFGGDNRQIVGKCYKCDIACEEIYDVDEDDGHEYQRIVCDNCVVPLGDRARRGNVYRATNN